MKAHRYRGFSIVPGSTDSPRDNVAGRWYVVDPEGRIRAVRIGRGFRTLGEAKAAIRARRGLWPGRNSERREA